MNRKLLLGAALVVGVILGGPAVAGAHPLGNFTVNHYHGLGFDPDGLTDHAVIDSAEIPTAQTADDVDTNGDGSPDEAERAAYATRQCDALINDLTFVADGNAVPLGLVSSSFTYRTGQAGLDVSRLECEIRGDVALTSATTVEFNDGFEARRVGWREMTATGSGVHLDESPVPAKSITDGLTTYPNDLLSSPLDVRDATVRVLPGDGTSTVADSIDTVSKAGPFTRLLDRVTGTFNDIVARDKITLNVGLLAIGLALLLGASHAVLPGHGKTVMAAYIAGRQGSMRDAFVVGATVTVTHTSGVIILGLALTASSSLAGDEVLRWLGVSSGLLVAGLGGSLLLNALRHRAPAHGHRHAYGTHTDDHSSHEHSTEGHDHGAHEPHPVLVHAGHSHSTASASPVHQDHDHAGHAHGHEHPHDHAHETADRDHGNDHAGHDHEEPVERVLSRRGLVAMGIAGGLVPSPSALVVLLAAIALGRTIFGVALVLCYGIGMAATLTATGLILVKLRDRCQGRAAERFTRRFASKWTRVIPYSTAVIVIAVGLLLTTRSLAGTV